jgi:anti-anti-sigma regulatory factor
MDTEVTQEDNGAVIRVSGILSGDTADEFVTVLRTTLAYEPKDVVLDLRNVTELGMRGVSGLIAARRLCGRADAVMDIIASVAVEHGLDSAHVTGLFRFTDPN